jgi:diguanylate cyclase
MADGASQNNSRRWWEVARLTILGTAAAIGVSLVLSYLLLFSDALGPFGRGVALAILLPVLIAAPLFIYIGMKLQDARAQQQRLNRLTTYDQTTGVVNGMVLAAVVERRAAARDVGDAARGGFVVVRLDNLLDINIEHGFAWGDEALRLVATAIRASVREGDTVGRLGASEFGVFPPGASEENARAVGERIRDAIEKVGFAPAGIDTPLAVRTGGVLFEHDLGFADMFRGAERQLMSRQSKSGIVLAGPASDTTKH